MVSISLKILILYIRQNLKTMSRCIHTFLSVGWPRVHRFHILVICPIKECHVQSGHHLALSLPSTCLLKNTHINMIHRSSHINHRIILGKLLDIALWWGANLKPVIWELYSTFIFIFCLPPKHVQYAEIKAMTELLVKNDINVNLNRDVQQYLSNILVFIDRRL